LEFATVNLVKRADLGVREQVEPGTIIGHQGGLPSQNGNNVTLREIGEQRHETSPDVIATQTRVLVGDVDPWFKSGFANQCGDIASTQRKDGLGRVIHHAAKTIDTRATNQVQQHRFSQVVHCVARQNSLREYGATSGAGPRFQIGPLGDINVIHVADDTALCGECYDKTSVVICCRSKVVIHVVNSAAQARRLREQPQTERVRSPTHRDVYRRTGGRKVRVSKQCLGIHHIASVEVELPHL
jgi:hypothetical protein